MHVLPEGNFNMRPRFKRRVLSKILLFFSNITLLGFSSNLLSALFHLLGCLVSFVSKQCNCNPFHSPTSNHVVQIFFHICVFQDDWSFYNSIHCWKFKHLSKWLCLWENGTFIIAFYMNHLNISVFLLVIYVPPCFIIWATKFVGN